MVESCKIGYSKEVNIIFDNGGNYEMAHMHITAWVLAIVLLILVVKFYKQGNTKPGKILHMILRLDYLFILYTGGSLFSSYYWPLKASFAGEIILKVVAGLWVIVALEMIAVKTNKKQSAKSWWIQFIIAAVVAIILGFVRLPYGILPVQ